ncbi:MAG TPA: reverse transcriptase domain-containing protein [Bacteroidales bacterium]|nr:reverse transcriptase domain-containing protein [Bacteroidales bacterium]HSA42066.1 reverse transcriptase domain-containing protein [Bacteroidales bacterium]
METMSTKRELIAKTARAHAGEPITNLHHYIDESWLEESLKKLNKNSAAGVDGKTYEEYERESGRKLPDLLGRFKTGSYYAPPVRRIYINKENGKRRPIGIPTIEDKILQEAVKMVVEPVYEQDFYDTSYGFRPGRSQHQALERVWQEVMDNHVLYILDADIENYFGSIDHGQLRMLLDQRIKDGVVRKQIDKWLKAGVMEDETLHYEREGTPQGGVISPLLSNIFLHTVLDAWYHEIKVLLKGKSFMVRYADDFVMGFERKEDAQRVMKVIFKRFSKYGLRLHPEKTRMISLSKYDQSLPATFDFHSWVYPLHGGKPERETGAETQDQQEKSEKESQEYIYMAQGQQAHEGETVD